MKTFLITLIGLMFYQVAYATDCNWVLSGNVKVDYDHRVNRMNEINGPIAPLENIKVKISTRKKSLGIWGAWGPWKNDIRTNANGRYEFRINKPCAKRQFRVDVKFQDNQLEMRHRNATLTPTKVKWYNIVDDNSSDVIRNASAPGLNINFGTSLFVEDGEFVNLTGDNYDEAFAHAQAWNVYRLMFEKLAEMGDEYKFRNRLKVKYPNNSLIGGETEACYANPINKVVYIYKNDFLDRDHFNIATLWHEAFHIWSYENVHGEGCLTEDLITTFNTHDLAPNSCSAFLEGFAEAAARQLMHETFVYSQPIPNSRAGLRRRGMNTVELVERLDKGWQSVFETMLLNDLTRWDFSQPVTFVPDSGAITGGHFETEAVYEDPNNLCHMVLNHLKLRHLLKVFLPNGERGYPDYMQVRDYYDMTAYVPKYIKGDAYYLEFFTRAASILNHMDENHALAIMDAQDPESDGDVCSNVIRSSL